MSSFTWSTVPRSKWVPKLHGEFPKAAPTPLTSRFIRCLDTMQRDSHSCWWGMTTESRSSMFKTCEEASFSWRTPIMAVKRAIRPWTSSRTRQMLRSSKSYIWKQEKRTLRTTPQLLLTACSSPLVLSALWNSCSNERIAASQTKYQLYTLLIIIRSYSLGTGYLVHSHQVKQDSVYSQIHK